MMEKQYWKHKARDMSDVPSRRLLGGWDGLGDWITFSLSRFVSDQLDDLS